MRNEILIHVPSGFQLLCAQESLNILDAGELLHTKKRYKYTSASRSGETVVLRRHRIKCPFCGYEIPAYPQYLADAGLFDRKPIPQNLVDAWFSPQLSFFEEGDAVISLNPVTLPETVHICPKCLRKSSPDKGSTEVRISSRGKKVTLTCGASIKCVLDLMKHPRQSGHLRFPLTECLEFNLGKGRVHLTVRNSDGSPALIRDLTCARELWKQTESYRVIQDSFLVRRALKHHFSRIWGGKLPFPSGELSPETFCSMTQFVGYPRVFYDTIPRLLSTGNLERSFVAISRRMRNADNLERLYKAASLPPMKSIRRMFFSEPGYFFYLPEARLLWQLFPDPNHYRTVLSMPRSYDLLSQLRQYPGMSAFFRDYLQRWGARKLLTRLTRSLDSILEYAVRYGSMGPRARQHEQLRWGERTMPTGRRLPYSIPMQTGCRRIPDCSLDGYAFCWLRTRQEYAAAGRALRNCLVDWSARCNPVVAVKKGETYKAAIEIRGDYVIQARGIGNSPIEEDGKLAKAVETWLRRHNLAYLPCPEEDEDGEDALFF